MILTGLELVKIFLLLSPQVLRLLACDTMLTLNFP